MIGKVISGGQSGVDAAALRAARAVGIATGGYAPRGWRTEYGPDRSLRALGLVEAPAGPYPVRTRMNVDAAAMTLILAEGEAFDRGRGTWLTQEICTAALRRDGKPFTVAVISADGLAQAFAALRRHLPRGGTLNVAGGRESKSPGVGGRAEAFLVELFTLLLAAGVEGGEPREPEPPVQS